MALTPEEQERLRQLRAERARRERDRAADDHQRRYDEAARPKDDEDPFSFNRTATNIGIGLVRDVSDLAYDLNRTSLFRAIQQPSYLLEDLVTGEEFGQTEDDVMGFARTEFENAAGTENAGAFERAVTDIGGWLVPFTGALKGLKAASFLGRAGRTSKAAGWARGAVAGAAADFMTGNEVEDNMFNFLNDHFGLEDTMVETLLSEEDDSAMEKRLKSTITGGLAGAATDAMLQVAGKTLKALKFWRGTRDEAQAIVANYDQGPIELNRAADDAAGETDEGFERVEADEVAHPSENSGAKWRIEPDDGRPIEDFDDVIQYIVDKAGDTSMSDDAFEQFAENLARGEPENLMARFGLKKMNLDESVFSDPDRLARLQTGLADAFEHVAMRLGRTGQRVPLGETMRAAESMATSPQTLMRLHRSTEGLASKLMAGRMIVGGHAHVLLDAAEAALREIEETGARGEAWQEYIKRFWQHGLILGTVVGAKSEIGRALQSLQKAAKWTSQTLRKAKQGLQKGMDEEAAEQSPHRLDRLSFEDAAAEYAGRITTNAEAIEALQNTIRLGGDAGELSRVVRTGEEGIWNKLDRVGAETVANLFTMKTAAVNLGAGLATVGVDGLAKLLVAAARSPAFVFGSEKARHEARRAAFEVWSYGQKATAWSAAFRNAVAVAQREGASELALHADAMGLESLAEKAQLAAGRAEQKISGNFERGDVVGQKAIAIPASTRKKLDKWASEEFSGDMNANVDKFMRMGFKSLFKVMALTTNTAGSLTRTGTSAFIHLPDQFVGTIAQQAEGYSKAVRMASDEAWERGLRGKDATTYIKARTEDLFAGGPSEWGKLTRTDDAYTEVADHARWASKDKLFQTKPQTWVGQKFAAAGYSFGTWLVPFVNTIVRITERTVTDYSPLGLVSNQFKEAIAKGGAARDEALARMFMGVIGIGLGYQLADRVVGKDGGYAKTARDAGIQSYSVKIGGDTFEFGSLEPVGSLLGIGADFREYQAQLADDPERFDDSTFDKFLSGAWFSVSSNILSKNWMQTVQKLSEALAARDGQEENALQQFFNTYAVRAVPGAGVQKAAYNWKDGTLREAKTFRERVLTNTVAAGRLPEKKDSLGRTLKREGLDRYLGIPIETMKTPNRDLIMSELGALNMRDFVPQRTQGNVKLTAEQLSRYTELRGTEVRDDTGMTLVEKLEAMFRDPNYQALTDAQRTAMVRKAKRPYGRLAREALEGEDPNFARERLKVMVFEEAEAQGWTRQQRGLMLEIVMQRFDARKQ